MNNIILLKNYTKEAFKLAIDRNNKRVMNREYHYTEEEIEKALSKLVEHNLKYSTKSGKLYLDGEVISEYVSKRDIPLYDSEMEVVEYQFVNYIMNSASRLTRGVEAV